jgi:group I intron endonuclease
MTISAMSVKRYINLDQSSVLSEILSDNRDKCGVYLLTNNINNKTYVGSSVNLSKRFLKYFNDNALAKNRMLISFALLKYKRTNFTLHILEYCSIENALTREQFYLDSIKPSYNILKVAGSTLGYTHTETSLLKMNNRTVSDATLAKMKARKQTDETKDKIRKSLGIPVQITNVHTKEITIYSSKLEAGLDIGVSDQTIGRYIKSEKLLLDKFFINTLEI